MMASITSYPRVATQEAPYPVALAELVARAEFDHWTFWLGNVKRSGDSPESHRSEGLTLEITVTSSNSYAPEEPIRVRHSFIVPAATYDPRAWQRWLFDCCLLVLTHEAMEYFKIDGIRPYAPNHGPGRNQYVVHERGTEDDAYTASGGGRIPNIV